MTASPKTPAFPDKRRGPRTRLLAGVLMVLAVLVLAVDILSRSGDVRETELDHLLAEARERAGELEFVLTAIDRGLSEGVTRFNELPAADLGPLTSAVREILAPHDTVLVGMALLDENGGIVRSTPEGLEELVPDLGIAEATVAASDSTGLVSWGYKLMADTLPVITFTRPVADRGGARQGFLTLVAGVKPVSGTWPDPDQSLQRPVFFLLDSQGYILSHPEREWVGYLLVTEADTLYDPELWELFPEILEPRGGAWALTSEYTAPGAWGHGLESLLASAPVNLPNGDRWHVVLTASETPGPLPGIPPVIRVGGTATILSVLLLAVALLLLLFSGWSSGGEGRGGGRGWYETLVGAGPDGLVVLAGRDRIVTGNEAFAAMAGMPVEELEGVRMSDLMDHPDPEGAPTEREGIDAGWSEGRLRRPDGSRLEVELHTAELSLESEPILLSLVRDLTWRRRLERETLRVGEKERLLVGKELHDGLGQHLTGVAFMAKTLAAKLVDSQGSEAEEAVRISHLVRDAVGQIRVLSKGLELTEYEPGELPQALGEMADVVRRLMGVDLGVELDLDGEDGAGELDTFLATQLYRFCHDVVSDAVRNQLARKIDVVIRRDGRRVLMIVSHDGKRPQGKEATSSTLSDYRLRYRARLLDAALNVTEGEEGKTTITCSFDAGGART